MKVYKALLFSLAAVSFWAVAVAPWQQPAQAAAAPAQAAAAGQPFDILIKGGHVLDPRNQIDAVMDVAIAGNKISQVAANIPATQARSVINVPGLYVTPGLVDLHVHAFFGHEPYASIAGGSGSLAPDGFTFRSGTTTVVDAGSAGWKNFQYFKDRIIDTSKTRILALLNIVGSGMIMSGPVEQNIADMDAKLTAARIRQYRDIIVGIKSAHYSGPEWESVDRAVEAGKLSNTPVMVHFGFVPERPFQDLVLKHLRPGDIVTHMYVAQIPMLDAQGKVLPYLFDARKRGVLFDVGHGMLSFSFKQAIPAVKQGFIPDAISSDLTPDSMNVGMKDLLNVMSKFLNMGMTMQQIIDETTSKPAMMIKRPDLGTLSAGSPADVAILTIKQGTFGFVDADGAIDAVTGGRGGRMTGTQMIQCELTIRDGKIVWDLNGTSRPEWDKAPAGRAN